MKFCPLIPESGNSILVNTWQNVMGKIYYRGGGRLASMWTDPVPVLQTVVEGQAQSLGRRGVELEAEDEL